MSFREHSFTPAEVSALAGIQERRVRKEIENRVFNVESPPRLGFASLVYLRAIASMEFNFGVSDRSRLYRKIASAIDDTEDEIYLTEHLLLRLSALVSEVSETLTSFLEWKAGLVQDPATMGGAALFPNSRLTVRHIGETLERGESTAALLEDYPYLSKEDLQHAQTYVRAYPRVGRPQSKSKTTSG